MTHPRLDVKFREFFSRSRDWLDAHPRTGWYIAAVATANLILQIVQIFTR